MTPGTPARIPTEDTPIDPSGSGRRPVLEVEAVTKIYPSEPPVTALRGVSFALADVHAHDGVTFADRDGIALRGGHHCNQPLMRKLGLPSSVRASFYMYNTEADIATLVTSLRRIVKFFAG